MILLIHIVIAISSVVYTIYLFLSPSRAKLRYSYLLVALTFVSGGFLVFAKPASLTQTCVTGLAYLAVMAVGIAAVRAKLNRLDTIVEISQDINP